ncbi:MAG: glycosyltransferase family 2 protein [Armatimonadota bacterium]
MVPTPDKSNICAVVVTYHPDNNFPQRVKSLSAQVDVVLIVDNASDLDQKKMIESIASQIDAEVVWNNDNLGVAAALNTGYNWASKRGYDWLLTMDQDTTLLDSAIESYKKAFTSFPDLKICMIGSNMKDPLTREPYIEADVFANKDALEVKTLITSGTLVSIEAAKTIGMYSERYYIDYLDAEFSLRARKNGFSNLITKEFLIEHTIGAPRYHKFLSRRLITSHHPSSRRYYLSRNYIFLIKDFWREEPKWLFDLGVIKTKEVILFLMFEEKRVDKLWKTILGAFDGIVGRAGKRY